MTRSIQRVGKVLAQCLLALLGASVILALFALLHAAQAQTVYRCGRTYSDTPCGPEAVRLASPAARPSVPQSAAIRVGWTESAALAALAADGWPVRSHVLETGDSVYVQYVIGRHIQNQWFIFARDGVVTSVLW